VETKIVIHHVLDAIRIGAGAIRNAVERVYPAAQWPIAPDWDGGQSAHGPAFRFLTGSIWKLPGWHPPVQASAAPLTLTSTR
jgi:hypothetical protein